MRDERAGVRRELIRLFTLAALVVGVISAPMLAVRTETAPAQDTDGKGEISIARPKVWQYERVETLMDGLLRDIEGVSLSDLTKLDPSEQNAAALQFVQSMLEVNAKFDQAAPAKFRNEQAAYELKHDGELQRLDEYNTHTGTLRQQRTRITTDLFAANNAANASRTKKASEGLSADEEARLTATQSIIDSLKTQLEQVNGLITAAGDPPAMSAAPTPASTSASDLTAAADSFGSFLGKLPEEFRKSITDGLKQPSYPATKRLDNFLMLLRERLAAEVSVLQDDVSRSPNRSAFLVQFDVGLYPDQSAKNHMATVEFDMAGCGNCSVYSLYPGHSSYNVASYRGTSSRRKITALISTLFGWGLNAGFQRQADTLRGSLVQSVYVSGFQDERYDGQGDGVLQTFGWRYSPAPFEEYVSPGIRSTFAIITMPRNAVKNFDLSVLTGWSKREEPKRPKYPRSIELVLPEASKFRQLPRSVETDPGRVHIMRLEYNPILYDPSDGTVKPDPLSACPRNQCAPVMIRVDVPIDANLVVTVRGRPLRRVRDWRGRATAILPPAQIPTNGTATAASRSLTEIDRLEPDSWYQVNSHELLLNISRDLVGTASFPSISLSDPARPTVLIPYDLRRDHSELVMSGFRLVPRSAFGVQNYARGLSGTDARRMPRQEDEELRAPLQTGPYPYSTFLPLFLPKPKAQRIFAFVGETGEELLIGMSDEDAGSGPKSGNRARWLGTRTRVILEDRELDFAWSLTCGVQGDLLACELPVDAIRETYLNLKVVCIAELECPVAWAATKQIPAEIAYDFIRNRKSAQTIAQDARNVRTRALARGERVPAGAIEGQRIDTVSLAGLGVPTLQVWVEQYDPENRLGLESLEPAALPFFPLQSSATRNTPLRFDGYDNTTGQLALKQCGAETAHTTEVTLLGSFTEQGPLPLKVSAGCLTTTVSLFELSRSPLVFRMKASVPSSTNASPEFSRFTIPVPTSQLLPQFGEPTTTAVQVFDGKRPITERWDVDWRISRSACGDTLGPELARAGVKQIRWRVGGRLANSPCDLSRESWNFADRSGQVYLHIEVPRTVLPSLPSMISLRRETEAGGSQPNSSMEVASTALLGLLLPSTLEMESMGAAGFVLRGANAGEIDAVSVQRDGEASKISVSKAGNYAQVNMESQKPGEYVIVPLIQIGTLEMPVTVRDDKGKPLVYRKAKPEEKPKTDEVEGDKTTTKTTITRTTETSKKPASNATPAAPAKPVVPPK